MASVTANSEKKDKALAAIITLIIHGALLLFLVLYVIITPIPPFPPPADTPELELDLTSGGGGSSGSSSSKPTTVDKVVPAAKAPESNTPTVNNDVEASTPIPSGHAKKVPKKIDTVAKQPQAPQPSVELVSIENKFKHAKLSTGGGNMGSDLGNGGGGSGGGQGGGNGPSVGAGKGFGYDLSGRQLEVRPKLVTNNPEQGQIVVGITVDQDGNVTEATPGVRGSTITDASLYELVKAAAMKVKFNKSPNDLPEQEGTVTFKFRIE